MLNSFTNLVFFCVAYGVSCQVKGKLSLLQTMRSKRVPGHTPFLVYFGYNLIYGAIRPSARLDREIKQEGQPLIVR